MTQIELIEGTTRNHELSQFFTPPKLAAKLVQWACDYRGGYRKTNGDPLRVLEPSAGNGAIVRELVAAGADVFAVEIDERYRQDLWRATNCGSGGNIAICDFLQQFSKDGRAFDLVCGNFPFHLDLDGAFTLHALKFAPRLCAIYPSNFFYAGDRIEFWKHVRPTRVAYMSKRAWKGATDYVALELVRRERSEAPTHITVEWWFDDWA